jgi:hypothetical protein
MARFWRGSFVMDHATRIRAHCSGMHPMMERQIATLKRQRTIRRTVSSQTHLGLRSIKRCIYDAQAMKEVDPALALVPMVVLNQNLAGPCWWVLNPGCRRYPLLWVGFPCTQLWGEEMGPLTLDSRPCMAKSVGT